VSVKGKISLKDVYDKMCESEHYIEVLKLSYDVYQPEIRTAIDLSVILIKREVKRIKKELEKEKVLLT